MKHSVTATKLTELPEGHLVRLSNGSYWILGRRQNSQTVEIYRPRWYWRLWWAVRDWWSTDP